MELTLLGIDFNQKGVNWEPSFGCYIFIPPLSVLVRRRYLTLLNFFFIFPQKKNLGRCFNAVYVDCISFKKKILSTVHDLDCVMSKRVNSYPFHSITWHGLFGMEITVKNMLMINIY